MTKHTSRFPAARTASPGLPSGSVHRLRVARAGGWVLGSALGIANAQAQDPVQFTDKIYQGNGVIDLLRDVSAPNLQQYLQQNSGLLLGVDVNENNAGNETSNSIGIALKQVQLDLTTTTGSYRFSDFATSTSAQVREKGSTTPGEYFTLFGKSGSSAITGATAGFDLGTFDDVLRLQNVSFTGNLLSAQLRVTFLNTPTAGAGANESFFDFSGGYEDFALLGPRDAALLEAANFGVADAPAGVTYTLGAPLITLTSDVVVTTEYSPPDATVPAAPAPPWWTLAVFGFALARLGRTGS